MNRLFLCFSSSKLESSYPTQELSIQFKNKPKGKWIAQQAQSRFLINGRHEVDMYLQNEDGEVVAIVRHMGTTVPFEKNLRNETGPNL